MGGIKNSIIGFSLGVILCAAIDYLWMHLKTPQEKPFVQASTDVKIDTIKHHVLIPKDTTIVSYRTKYSYKIRDSTIFSQKEPSCEHDTVILPITQKHYKDSTYEAWVSGYEPNLDSINIYQYTKFVNKQIIKKQNWGIGIQVGIGNKKPYIGIGIQYNILQF